MAKENFKKSSKKEGLPPGTIVHTGKIKKDLVKIRLIECDEKHFSDAEVPLSFIKKNNKKKMWINLDGVHNTRLIAEIGEKFGIHNLVLEDIADVTQRPKIEDYENYVYIVARMIYLNPKENQYGQTDYPANKSSTPGKKSNSQIENRIISEQISFIIGKNYLISFQENTGDVFDKVRERMKNGKKLIRKKGIDYLLYALLDAIVDNYFTVLEKIGEEIEILEEELAKEPKNETLEKIHKLKREMIILRKSVWPLREVISALTRNEPRIIHPGTIKYLRDVYDHTIQIIDTVETFRDILSGMIDLYLSSISNKMNEIMKVLTIIATIFIPLTFIAGVYGMNFKYMPELEWSFGYYLTLGIMALVGIVMLLYFKKKRWI